MNSRRVALVFPGIHRQGGVERAAWEYSRHLAAHCDIVAVAERFEPDPAGIVVHHQVPGAPRRWPRSLEPFRFRRAARKALAALDADVVVSFGANCPPGDIAVVNSVHRAWLGVGKEITVGPLTVPNWMRWMLPRHVVLLALERSYFRASTTKRIAAVSDQVVTDLRSIYGVDHDRCVVVHNGYDPTRFAPAVRAALREDARRALGISSEEVSLLLVANELQRKGLPVLLEAIAECPDLPVRLHIIGRSNLSAFERRIQQLGIEDRVVHHGATDDVAKFHAACDVFVLPTQYEAFALAIVEAMASGMCVITTNVPGAADLVIPDETGLLLDDPLDASGLASLIRVVVSPHTRDRLGTTAAESVQSLTWSALALQLKNAIDHV